MHFSRYVLLALAGLSFNEVLAQRNGDRRGGNNNSGTAGGAAAATTTGNTQSADTPVSGAQDEVHTLNSLAVQSASNSKGDANAEAGQSDSATDDSNFINFCANVPNKTNGTQVQGGSCNGIVMGNIPSTANMISTLITSPKLGQVIAPNTAFTINVQVQNLVAGRFTNPATTYYAAPQDLVGGKVVGHTHVTVQDLGGNIFAQNPPDATKFAFFKGINDVGNGNGALSAAVAGGLPEGIYRLCTMTSAANHQPVLMPVAQRGAQDDCIRLVVSNNANAFVEAVGGGNTGSNNNNNQGNNNQGNNNGQGNSNNQGTSNNQGNNNNQGANNNNNNNSGSGSATGSQTSSSAAGAANGNKAAETGTGRGGNNNNQASSNADSGSSSGTSNGAASMSTSTSVAGNNAGGSGSSASSATPAGSSSSASAGSGNGTTGNGRNGHGGRGGGRRHRKFFAKNFVA